MLTAIFCANARIVVATGDISCYNTSISIHGGLSVGIIYKMLWKLLIDKDMNKGDLQRVARISASSVAELSKGADIQTDHTCANL
jgi:hypothetical protein